MVHVNLPKWMSLSKGHKNLDFKNDATTARYAWFFFHFLQLDEGPALSCSDSCYLDLNIWRFTVFHPKLRGSKLFTETYQKLVKEGKLSVTFWAMWSFALQVWRHNLASPNPHCTVGTCLINVGRNSQEILSNKTDFPCSDWKTPSTSG